MIQQLAVIDENGAQIGMTFPKRAKQLVSKQRALWHDKTHTAIRLLPGQAEETDLKEELSDEESENDCFRCVATKRVKETRRLVRNIVGFILLCILVTLFCNRGFSSDTYNAAYLVGFYRGIHSGAIFVAGALLLCQICVYTYTRIREHKFFKRFFKHFNENSIEKEIRKLKARDGFTRNI